MTYIKERGKSSSSVFHRIEVIIQCLEHQAVLLSSSRYSFIQVYHKSNVIAHVLV